MYVVVTEEGLGGVVRHEAGKKGESERALYA